MGNPSKEDGKSYTDRTLFIQSKIQSKIQMVKLLLQQNYIDV